MFVPSFNNILIVCRIQVQHLAESLATNSSTMWPRTFWRSCRRRLRSGELRSRSRWTSRRRWLFCCRSWSDSTVSWIEWWRRWVCCERRWPARSEWTSCWTASQTRCSTGRSRTTGENSRRTLASRYRAGWSTWTTAPSNTATGRHLVNRWWCGCRVCRFRKVSSRPSFKLRAARTIGRWIDRRCSQSSPTLPIPMTSRSALSR